MKRTPKTVANYVDKEWKRTEAKTNLAISIGPLSDAEKDELEKRGYEMSDVRFCGYVTFKRQSKAEGKE